jgi:Lrp/AsnC family transcriptional regulator for asnA, asnC and gidA
MNDTAKPDTLDLRLIRELREDGRMLNTMLAKRLEVSEATITARIRGLSDNGIMKVMAQRDYRTLGYTTQCFVDISTEGRTASDVADDLARLERISSVNLAVGSPEIYAVFFAKDHGDVVDVMEHEIGRVAGVQRCELAVCLKIGSYRSDYGILSAGHTQPLSDELDTEERIIRVLQQDGRASFREVSRALDIPETTVRDRIKRLLETRAIRIGVVCDTSRMGFEVAGYAKLCVKPQHLEAALERLSHPEDLGFVAAATGRFNIVSLFGARNFKDFIRISKTRFETLPGIIDADVRVVTETRKHRYDLIYLR